jgi:hypothetical protein
MEPPSPATAGRAIEPPPEESVVVLLAPVAPLGSAAAVGVGDAVGVGVTTIGDRVSVDEPLLQPAARAIATMAAVRNLFIYGRPPEFVNEISVRRSRGTREMKRMTVRPRNELQQSSLNSRVRVFPTARL